MANKTDISSAFLGRHCTNVVRYAVESWTFDFGEDTVLDVRCPWRIVTGSGVALGFGDHGQEFGLRKPVDGVQEAMQLLEQPVSAVTIRPVTSDIVVNFGTDIALETFNSSSGYEGWECSSKTGLLAIGVGGGELQTFITDPPLR